MEDEVGGCELREVRALVARNLPNPFWVEGAAQLIGLFWVWARKS